MGSGQGRTRRSRAATARLNAPAASSPSDVPTRGAVFNRQKWQVFLRESDLEGMSLHKYYLGKKDSHVPDYQLEKVVTELFADAVEVGAIILPSPYKPADFEFKVKASDGFGLDSSRIDVSLLGKPHIFSTVAPTTYLGSVYSLSDGIVADSLGFIFAAIRKLI